MPDVLNLDKINALPQPMTAEVAGLGDWPVFDIDVQTALLRIDVMGKLDLLSISEIINFVDAGGTTHNPDTFWLDYDA